MAKPLTSIPPSSSVAKLLEPGIGAAATRSLALPQAGQHAAPHAGVPAPPQLCPPTAGDSQAIRATGEPADIKRELTLTRSTDDTLSELLALFQRTTGCRLHTSHLMRAMLKVLCQAMPEIEREARALGPLRRPSNASGREAERDEFESRLAASLRAGLRARGRRRLSTDRGAPHARIQGDSGPQQRTQGASRSGLPVLTPDPTSREVRRNRAAAHVFGGRAGARKGSV